MKTYNNKEKEKEIEIDIVDDIGEPLADIKEEDYDINTITYSHPQKITYIFFILYFIFIVIPKQFFKNLKDLIRKSIRKVF